MKFDLFASAVDGPSDASVLVLSNSLGTTSDLWLPQLETLSRKWRVVRFDHPGHGRSEVWDGPVTVERIGLGVLGLLDRMDVERVSFCGISLGGGVGQWLAARAPERVERLILCSTAAHFDARDAYLTRAATVRARGMTVISSAVVERWFTPNFRAQQPAVVTQYRSMLEAIPPDGYAACCEAVAEFDGRNDLQSITAPTLVIAGADDPATPVEYAQFLVDRIADARLVTIERAAHLANVEQPGAVARAIVNHLGGPA